MIDGQVPLQKAIVAAVKAATGLPIGDRIFDSVPANAVLPYSSFGPFETVGVGGACDAAIEVDVQIDSWSRAVGTVEAKEAAGALARLLTAEGALTPEGFRVDFVRFLLLRGQSGLDGRTSQSILKLRVGMKPTA